MSPVSTEPQVKATIMIKATDPDTMRDEITRLAQVRGVTLSQEVAVLAPCRQDHNLVAHVIIDTVQKLQIFVDLIRALVGVERVSKLIRPATA